MSRLFLAALAAAVAFLLVPAGTRAQDAEERVEWNRPIEPFRVTGTVFYVGTQGLSAFLIAGDKGHVLIDGGLPESAPLIAANIRKLGFRLDDVRLILVNHAHGDHAGGLAELKRLTGARLAAMAADAPSLEAGATMGRPGLLSFPPVKVDRLVRDGDVVRLGDLALVAHATPGHTPGCTSWATRNGDKTVLFACSLTVAGQTLQDNPAYPEVAADFRATFAKLRGMRADVFLNFHPEFFDMAGKRARIQAGEADAFVDPGELPQRVARASAAFEAELKAQAASR
jgi:metallo-beta-lactamase class B